MAARRRGRRLISGINRWVAVPHRAALEMRVGAWRTEARDTLHGLVG
jgi:hypothetical protein